MDKFKSKYNKYLLKSRNIEKMIGGIPDKSSTINSICVSHNGRIRCFLNTLGINADIRLKNCAILKFSLTPINGFIEMVYSGEVNDNRKYYVSTISSNPKEILFPRTEFTGGEYQQLLTKLKIAEPIQTNLNYFIVRHGQGVHNVSTGKKILKILTTSNISDALLDQTGVQQATSAGEALKTFLSDQKINYLFVSDLRRTRQTLSTLLSKIKDNLQLNTKNVTVLPCLHELDYNTKGCDGSQSVTAPENQAKCETNLKHCKELCCSITPDGMNTLPIDWSFYKNFYGNGTRNNPGKNRKHCRDTSFIAISLQIIKNGK